MDSYFVIIFLLVNWLVVGSSASARLSLTVRVLLTVRQLSKKNHKIHAPQTLSSGLWILKVQTDKL